MCIIVHTLTWLSPLINNEWDCSWLQFTYNTWQHVQNMPLYSPSPHFLFWWVQLSTWSCIPCMKYDKPATHAVHEVRHWMTETGCAYCPYFCKYLTNQKLTAKIVETSACHFHFFLPSFLILLVERMAFLHLWSLLKFKHSQPAGSAT